MNKLAYFVSYELICGNSTPHLWKIYLSYESSTEVYEKTTNAGSIFLLSLKVSLNIVRGKSDSTDI